MDVRCFGIISLVFATFVLQRNSDFVLAQQYWNENGGEIPATSGSECPELGIGLTTSRPGGQVVPRRYTKCYKTELDDSVCYQSKGRDCFNTLRNNLADESRRTVVCCPGACAWIYEHAWIDGQGLFKGNVENANQPVYSRGKYFLPDGAPPLLAQPTILPGNDKPGLFPTLHAGCALELPSPTASVSPVSGSIITPRSCPVLAGPGTLNQPGTNTPLCVQRLYKNIKPTPPGSADISLFLPQTACTIHCCETDLCNGDSDAAVQVRPGFVFGRGTSISFIGHYQAGMFILSSLTTTSLF